MIDLNNYLFWLVVAIWFTVPIMSWGWSLASLYFYRKLIIGMKDATAALEQAKTLTEQSLQYRLETLELRTKAEEEIRLVCTYYSKIFELIEKNDHK
jgi:phosphate/sulfate permease